MDTDGQLVGSGFAVYVFVKIGEWDCVQKSLFTLCSGESVKLRSDAGLYLINEEQGQFLIVG